MDHSERPRNAFQEDQRKIQRQYQLALEQRAKLDALKQRSHELGTVVERQLDNARSPEQRRRAG